MRGAFASAAIGMAIVALDGTVVRSNRALGELVGWTEEQLLGRALSSVVHPDDAPIVDGEIARMKAGARVHDRVEVRCAPPSGPPRWALLTCSFVTDTSAPYFIAQLEDIAERKAAEERLERYRLLSESARDIILFIALDGAIVEANDAAVTAYGYTRDELQSMNIVALRAEDTQGQVMPQMRAADSGGILFETMHRRKDGSTFQVQVSSQGAAAPNQRLLLSIIRDVTDRARLRDQLMHADRLVALGTLTASIVHEINNPLGYLINNLDLAARTIARGGATDGLAGFIADARTGAHRMRTIVHSTRALLRSDEQSWQPVDVRDVLESTIQMTWFEIRERARLVRDYAEVPPVAAKESQLGQVFLNLLINAIQALPEHDVDHHELRLVTRTSDAGAVVIEVRDTGAGIGPGVLEHIFDPFFTTKPPGVGTGLGLSISQGLVAAMGGTITVESEVGRGSVFRVTLPAMVDAEPVSVEAPRESELRVGDRRTARRGRVLVIDDEPALCATVRHVMALDHEVVTIDATRAALALFERDRDFDVVFCAVDMPESSGRALRFEVSRRWPDLADRFVFLGGAEEDGIEHVEVPLAMGELQRVVEERIGRRRA